MKRFFILYYLCCHSVIYSQGFECNESMYVVVYTETPDKSTLYEIKEVNGQYTFSTIELSENRHLSSLVYNVLDKHLFALDVDTYELIRIDRNGNLESLGVPENIDMNMQYKAGTMLPDGSAIMMLVFDPVQNRNTSIYTINSTTADLFAGYLGTTGPPNIDVADFATDPITGVIYGFDSHENKVIQIGIAGEITTLFYPDTGENFIGGIFFNQKGELFGYSPVRGLFAIDKDSGEINLITRGPAGVTADGCSCPYTYEFTKTISPKEIIPCEPFEVNYNFINRLGIGQPGIDLRDTFPDGFEILEIDGNIVFNHTIIQGTPKNILALENLNYLMRGNPTTLKVLPSQGFTGEFGSRARQYDFPLAFDRIHYTDDPTTAEFEDETIGEVLVDGGLDFNNNVVFSCDGKTATISSPFEADQYDWSNNSMASSIMVDQEGWYTLTASTQCFNFYDSILIDLFLPEKEMDLGPDQTITLGDSVFLMPSFNRESIPAEIKWMQNGQEINCDQCDGFWAKPLESGEFSVEVLDDAGCILEDDIFINVNQEKNIYVPNAFSPNGDGVNETLYISSSLPGQVLIFEIYDRWGNLIHSQEKYPISNIAMSWDGTFDGKKIGVGAYIWRAEIDFIDGSRRSYSGEVIIMDN